MLTKTKKRILGALLSASLIVGLFAGCSGNSQTGSPTATASSAPQTQTTQSTAPEASGKKTPLSLWFWGSSPEQQAAMQETLIDKFNAEHPDFELTAEFRSSVNQDIAVALAANQGPDIVYESAPSMAINYIKAGKYADLTEYDQKFGWKDKLIGPMYDSCTVDGTLYSIPVGIHVIGMVYNKRTLEENGWQVPTTVDEITKIMDEAIAKGMYGSVTGNKGWKPTNQDYSSLFLCNFAGPMETYKALTGEIKWNSPDIKFAVEKSAEWYQKGYLCSEYVNMDWGEAAALIADGQAPFFFGPLKWIQNLMPFCQGESKDDFVFTVFPGGREGVSPAYAIGTSATFAVNANSQYKDEAADFLNLLMNEEFVKEMAVKWPGYWGVPLKTLGQIDRSGFEGLSKLFMDSIVTACAEIDKGNFGYDNTTYFSPEVLDHFVNIDTVWFGEATPDELLDAVDASFQKEMAAGLVPPVPKPAG